MDYTPALIAAFASLTGAALAATVTLLVSILAKESKTSELRQQWIDAVRSDLGDFVAHIGICELAYKSSPLDFSTKHGQAEFLKAYSVELTKASALEMKLMLRMNPREHVALIELIERQSKFIEQGRPAARGASLEDEIVSEGQRVLKAEWERVKKGEPAFYISKRVAMAVVAGSLLSILVLAYRAF